MNKNLFFRSISISAVVLLLFSCNKSAKWSSTSAVITITHNSLALSVSYDISGAKNDVEVGVCWNDTGNPNLDNGSYIETITSSTSLDFIIDNLYSNHVYYFRPFVYRNDGTALIYGEEKVVTTKAVAPFENCSLTTGIVEHGTSVFSVGNLTSYLNSQTFQLSVTSTDFDFTFHFKEEPQSGIYLHDASTEFLQDFQCYMTVQVFDGTDNCTYYGSVDQAIHVTNENDIITLSFCELEVATSGTCAQTLLLSSELSGS